MTDSSLSLTREGFYPMVSVCCNDQNAVDYLPKLQERIERRLEKRIGQHRLQRQSRTHYCEMSDLMVDRLLLRYLLPCQRCSTQDAMVTHLITDDCLPKPLDESCHDFRILPLVCETSDGTLCQQFLGQLFNLFERATTKVGSGRCCRRSVRVPGQPTSPFRLFRVSIYR